jgi:ABC-type uncharacterized transport system permease subunit
MLVIHKKGLKMKKHDYVLYILVILAGVMFIDSLIFALNNSPLLK